jgi:hypothetical protein
MSDESSHWLDRLAQRYTRRQALKAAAAGAALSALPLVRSAPALADDPHACRQGCLWTSHQTAISQYDTCWGGSALANLLVVGYAPMLGLGFLQGGALGLSLETHLLDGCADRAAATEKAFNTDCMQPGCPDFDPKGANGPCEGVTTNCCPCTNVIQGYQPCVYPCDDPTHDCCGG